MRALFLALIVSLSFNVSAQTFSGTIGPDIKYTTKERPLKLYTWQVLRVVDGDTLEIHIPSFPDELTPLKIRILGIDTPEKIRAGCQKEKDLGYAATKYVTDVVEHAHANNKSIKFGNIKWDKYGGRIDADVFISGKPLAPMIINAGFARPYDGGKKSNWCD